MAAIAPIIFVFALFILVCDFLGNGIILINATATALWFRKFDVASWGKSEDPLPEVGTSASWDPAAPAGVAERQGVRTPEQPLESKPAPEEYVNKIKESVRRGMENLDRNNDWWVNVIMATIVVGYQDIDTVGDAEFIASAITGEKLMELVKTYCNTDNYATVILYPED